MHYNYKLDENILKTLIQRNILPTDPNEKLKLIIYNDKFKTSSLVLIIISPSWLEFWRKQMLFVGFRDCVSEGNNIYVCLTSTTLSGRLTMHLSGTSSMAQHLN